AASFCFHGSRVSTTLTIDELKGVLRLVRVSEELGRDQLEQSGVRYSERHSNSPPTVLTDFGDRVAYRPIHQFLLSTFWLSLKTHADGIVSIAEIYGDVLHEVLWKSFRQHSHDNGTQSRVSSGVTVTRFSFLGESEMVLCREGVCMRSW